jgi:hypothetical protein
MFPGMIRQEWFILYDKMIRDMEGCKKWRPDTKAEIECCFNAGRVHWGQIERKMIEYRFESKEEEIEFYKHVKPLFKSHIEFYNRVYHSELFKPVESPGEMKEFWIREQQRLDKFILDNADFFAYYKSGRTDRDAAYFLLREDVDDLLVTLLALKKYSIYIQNELDKIHWF